MLTVSIQAGGRSSRMGRDKALLPLASKPLIERVAERVGGVGQELIVTTNDPDRYAFLGVRLVSDPQPGAGALHGLLTALHAAAYDRVLIVGCDMPFLSRALLQRLAQLAPHAEVVIPYHDRKYEPLVAVYARSCTTAIQRSLAAGESRMISFLDSVDVLPVGQDQLNLLDPEGLSFFNVNTPEDLQRAEQLLGQQSA